MADGKTVTLVPSLAPSTPPHPASRLGLRLRSQKSPHLPGPRLNLGKKKKKKKYLSGPPVSPLVKW